MSIVPSPINMWYGVTQTNSARPTLEIPARPDSTTELIYAPTLLPPGGTCIEATTIHQWFPGLHAGTKTYQGWFAWCYLSPQGVKGRWALIESMDNFSFKNNYLRILGSDTVLSIAIVTPATGSPHGACWSGNIYNYTVGGWEEKLNSCGNGVTYSPSNNNGDDGWTGWESYYVLYQVNTCPTIDRIFATAISLNQLSDYTAHPIAEYWPNYLQIGGENGAECWTNLPPFSGSYTLDFPTFFYNTTSSWLARTP